MANFVVYRTVQFKADIEAEDYNEAVSIADNMKLDDFDDDWEIDQEVHDG